MLEGEDHTVEPLNNRHTLGQTILSIIERLFSFRGKNVPPLYRLIGVLESVLYIYRGVLYSECPLSEAPLYYQDCPTFTQRCTLFRVEVPLYTHVHVCGMMYCISALQSLATMKMGSLEFDWRT